MNIDKCVFIKLELVQRLYWSVDSINLMIYIHLLFFNIITFLFFFSLEMNHIFQCRISLY